MVLKTGTVKKLEKILKLPYSLVGQKINHSNVSTSPMGPILDDISGKHTIYLWFSFTIVESWNNLQTCTESKNKLWEIENEEDTEVSY